MLTIRKNYKINKNLIKKAKYLHQGMVAKIGYINSPELARIAKYQEFGTIYIPSRPFMKLTILNNKDDWFRLLKDYLEEDKNVYKALEKISRVVRYNIRETLANTPTTMEPLKLRTILNRLQKDKYIASLTHPLIDTGKLLYDIDIKIGKYY